MALPLMPITRPGSDSYQSDSAWKPGKQGFEAYVHFQQDQPKEKRDALRKRRPEGSSDVNG